MLKLSLVLLMVLLSVGWSWAQSSDPTQASDTQTSNSGATPAMGQEPNPPSASQFPPLSGLDEASLEPNVAARSFLVLGAQASELMDSNASNNLGRNSALTGVTHLLGSAALQRLWERYQVGLDYVGGGALYAGSVRQNAQMHELSFEARTSWRTGALTLRDNFSYLPDGTFGGGFGEAGALGGTGLGGVGGGLGGGSGNRFTFFGGNTFGALGAFPRVNNLSVLDLAQSLSPRSSFTLAGGYNFMHFTKSTGGLLIDSRSTTGQAGYDYTINRRNKVALIYGYQHFQFPSANGLSFVTQVAQVLYGYQLTGRMDLLVGAGPQFTHLSSTTGGSTLKLSASGRASLRYKFSRASLTMSYDRYNSVASGFFAGARTDMARLTYQRPLGRRWSATAHAGYEHNRRLQAATVAVNASSFQTGFAGLRIGRVFSRSLQGFVFYDFNDLDIAKDFCGAALSCNRTSIRHVAGLGLTWHPHAIRLD